MSQSNTGYVTTTHEQGIATIEFFHPQSNSLPGHLLESLSQAIHTEGINEQTKVIILRSGGEGVFCAGASFDELASIETAAEGLTFFSGFANVINAIRKAPKFVIARVHGKCVGGGVGLAAAADYAIAAEGSHVKLSELAVGIGPFVVGPAVERKIGLSAFSQLAMNAQTWQQATWASDKGLYAELHSDIRTMDEAVLRLTNQLAAMSINAMAEMKKMFWAGTEHWDEFLPERAAISGRLILGEHSKAAIQQFKNKAAKS